MFLKFTAAVKVFAAISLAATVANAKGKAKKSKAAGRKGGELIDETYIATCIANNQL